MKRIVLCLIMVFFFWGGNLQVQAGEVSIEEASETTIFSGDGVVKITLPEDWLLFNSKITYDDAFYEEWQLNKDVVEKKLVGSGDGILALHKYEDWMIFIMRISQKIPDYRELTDSQFEQVLKSIREEGRREDAENAIEYSHVYENAENRYIVCKAWHKGIQNGIIYQTSIGGEIVQILIVGNNVSWENEEMLTELVDKVTYEKFVESYEGQKNSDENFFRASGAATVNILIAVIIIAAIIQHRNNKKID